MTSLLVSYGVAWKGDEQRQNRIKMNEKERGLKEEKGEGKKRRLIDKGKGIKC